MGQPKLVPLQQWYCDTCAEVIESPKDGWMEWTRNQDERILGIRICHHGTVSPLKRENGLEGCYKYSKPPKGDMHLEYFLGQDGLVKLLSWVDVGRIHAPNSKMSVIETADIPNWADTCRRLFVPYYEEGRRYFDKAKRDGLYEGASEHSPFYDVALRKLIEKYGD